VGEWAGRRGERVGGGMVSEWVIVLVSRLGDGRVGRLVDRWV
jgi:hypothetical protein